MKNAPKFLLIVTLLTIGQLLIVNNELNAQNVGINEPNPDSSALLELTSTERGLIIPRMTTAQRDSIDLTGSPHSVLIFNTTTECYEGYNANTSTWVAFGCIGCTVPTAVTASASPNPICAGDTLTLTGDATDAVGWSWSGPNGFSSTSQSPTIAGITTAGAGVYTLTASNTCGSAAPVNTDSVTVNEPPTTAAAGADTTLACDTTTVTLAGNDPTVGTGLWTVESGTATITTPGSPTSGVTGLAVPGTATLRWTISNPPCTDSYDEVVITTTACVSCPPSLAINHTIGSVAPETKSVTYGVVLSNLTGADKCWITRNLGASTQATSATDATDASAGWYWQFNRKQGYMVGPTPAWTITSIDETSDWVAAQDPCTIELGTGWRIPTKTEWENADANGGWDNYNDTYASVLKLHAAGYLVSSDGSLDYRGTHGFYWSSIQDNATYGRNLYFDSSGSSLYFDDKAYGFSVRCLRD